MTEFLDARTIHAALSTAWLGRVCHYHHSLPSTNTTLKEMVTKGSRQHPPAGTLVITDYQTQGKGRLNRHWQAPAATSLLFSVLFRPNWQPERANWLTMLAALAAAETIEAETGLYVGLKWPNDLIVGRPPAWRKVGGILLEGDIAQNRLESAILGLGLNVNIAAAELPAGNIPPTSLLIESGCSVSRLTLLASLLARLEEHYEAARQGKSPQPAWNSRLINLGRSVSITAPGQPFEGIVEGTDSWGHLLVRDDSGVLRVIAAGDVILR